MDEKQLQVLANELAKNLKIPDDLSQFDRLLKKISVEAALNTEVSHHLGYDKNQSKPGANSSNGYSTKTVTTGDGPLELRTPRDRDSPPKLRKTQPLPADKPELAGKSEQSGDVLRLSGRHPQGDLHNECHRVAEQRDPACHQKA